MAPVAAASQPSAASKIKRPAPPGIQTNGVSSSRSSPSPSMSAKRPPSAARQQSNPPNANGAAASSARPPNRQRKEASAQLLGRGQRSAGLRSASIVPDFEMSHAVDPPPYSKYPTEYSHHTLFLFEGRTVSNVYIQSSRTIISSRNTPGSRPRSLCTCTRRISGSTSKRECSSTSHPCGYSWSI